MSKRQSLEGGRRIRKAVCLFQEQAAAPLKGRQSDRRNCKKFRRPVNQVGKGYCRDEAEEGERGSSMMGLGNHNNQFKVKKKC